MFVSNQLIYLELPKTGTTHVRKLLAMMVDGRLHGKHNRVKPAHFQPGRRFLGSVRNPWDWYISLWSYGCGGKGGVAQSLRRHPRCKSLYNPARKPESFRAWLKLMMDPEDVGKRDPVRPGGSSLFGFCGLFTLRFCKFFFDPRFEQYFKDIKSLEQLKSLYEDAEFIDYFIRLERLNQDFVTALAGCGIDLSFDQRVELEGVAPTNQSPWNRNASDYYDAESIGLVAEQDRFIIEKFDYQPPQLKDANDDSELLPQWIQPQIARVQ